MAKCLVVDLDNTLYDFDGFFSLSITSMVSALSSETGVPEHRLIDDIGHVLKNAQTIEHYHLIEDLPSLGELTDRDMKRLVNIGATAFRKKRAEVLRPYPGVRETLRWAKHRGIIIVGLTDAPSYQAHARLRRLNLSTYLDALYSWRGPARHPQIKRYARQPAVTEELDDYSRKPNRQVLENLIVKFGIDRHSTLVVGDNLTRDVKVANLVGAVSVWAKYGCEVDPGVSRRMSGFSPGASHQKANTTCGPNDSDLVPRFTIHAFTELVELINGQLPLFAPPGRARSPMVTADEEKTGFGSCRNL